MATPRILVAIDGSDAALASLRAVLRRPAGTIQSLDLVNVQPPLPRYIAAWIAKPVRDRWRAERSAVALAPAVRAVEASGVPFRVHTLVGERRRSVREAARAWGCSEIIAGRGELRPGLGWLALPAGVGLAAWLLLD